VGATGGEPPPGFVVDRTEAVLGRGVVVFERARRALEGWEQFGLGWVEARPVDTPIRVGADVAVVARLCGLWWLNACRIVSVVDEEGPAGRRFGFAYGTLPVHAGAGEERFLVEWDRRSDEVRYEVGAFSRPQLLLTKVVYPYMRRLQARFGPGTVAAMQRAVGGA
jgi:uncharacterized protein (UPF0548 family)